MNAIDLFAGLGGWTAGARMAGVNVVWAGNHWPEAVKWHSANHPDAIHVCQDLHLADWTAIPANDLMLASPCCHGHTFANGKQANNPKHDASRATAWAVVSAAEVHLQPVVIVENVTGFIKWKLYPAWCAAMHALGYQLSPHIVDCADLGVPQNRVRLFIVCTLSKNPLILDLPKLRHVPASSFIDFNAGQWTEVNNGNRAAATLARITNGRAGHGNRFIMPYYKSGSGLTGRSLNRPIGTITTRARWAVVDGEKMRMLTGDETLMAMTFPRDTKRPNNLSLTIHLAGNAVPPLAGQRIIEAIKQAA